MAFRDPVHELHQSVILSKESGWEKMAQFWEILHERFREAVKEKEAR